MAEAVPAIEAPPEADVRVQRLERRIERERGARAEAEGLLEAKSRELYTANQLLSRLAADLEQRVTERTRELAAARERALELADRDQLTGLANRTCFARVLDASIAGSLASGRRFALLLVDLDRFKDINDTLGHEAGDVFLRHVSAQLRHAAREGGIVARLGGDEFAVIVPLDGERGGEGDGEGDGDVGRIADGLVKAARLPTVYRERALEASASIGVAVFPDDAQSAVDLQRYADIALYSSKTARATYTLYDPAMGRAMDARQSLGTELVRAIREGQIEAWFQPIVDGASSRPTSCEALARWAHPTRGLLAPGQFLDLAEQRGLMHDLFARMMRSACPPARRWIEAGAIRSLSINVSPSQFKLGSVAEDVIALLQELDFPPEALVIEITEEVLMHDLDRTCLQLERLNRHGVRIALDDFGIGYSNIGVLRRLPIHTLKLDRSLVADVTSERKVRSILGALVEIARALELDLVAEGVEEQAQALWLANLGCRRLQGYLFGKPMPEAEFERAIASAPGRPLSPTAAALDLHWLA